MLKKFFMGLIAFSFILFGSLILLMGYVFNNPEVVFHAFTSISDKFIEGQDYEEKEEFFLQGIQQIDLRSRHVNLHLQTYEGSTLKILLEGKVPRFEKGPFIFQNTEKNILAIEFQEPLASQWIQMNINGEPVTSETDAQLQANIYVPKSFKKRINIETRQGQVVLQLPETEFYEIDLQSVSGKIENHLKQKPTSDIQPQDVGQIRVQTDEGSIRVEPLN